MNVFREGERQRNVETKINKQPERPTNQLILPLFFFNTDESFIRIDDLIHSFTKRPSNKLMWCPKIIIFLYAESVAVIGIPVHCTGSILPKKDLLPKLK